MQFQVWAGHPGAGATRALPAEVVQLLGALPSTPGPRAAALDEREQRLRRREQDWQNVAADAAAAPRPSETMLRGEREMAAGSQAARRAQVDAQVRERASQPTREFREALSQARGRTDPGGRDPGSTPKPEAASASASALQDAKPPPPKTANANPLPAGGAPTPPPGTSTSGAQPTARTPVNLPAWLPANGSLIPPTPDAVRPMAAGKTGAVGAVSAGAAPASPASSGPSAVRAAPEVVGAPGVAADRGAAQVRKGAAATPLTPDDAAETSNPDANVERILRLIHTRLGKDRSVSTIRLDPPELGSLRVRMDLRAEQLVLRFDADNPAARDLLLREMDALRQGLEAAGVQLRHVEVRGPEPVAGFGGEPQSAADPQSGADARQQSAAREDAGHRDTGPPLASAETGREMHAAEGTNIQPAAESLVNVWA